MTPNFWFKLGVNYNCEKRLDVEKSKKCKLIKRKQYRQKFNNVFQNSAEMFLIVVKAPY